MNDAVRAWQRAWNEYRMLWAQRCLGLALTIAPKDTEDGLRFIQWVRDYCIESVARRNAQPTERTPTGADRGS